MTIRANAGHGQVVIRRRTWKKGASMEADWRRVEVTRRYKGLAYVTYLQLQIRIAPEDFAPLAKLAAGESVEVMAGEVKFGDTLTGGPLRYLGSLTERQGRLLLFSTDGV